MKKEKIKKWLFYSLVLLAAYILQTTIFNRFRIAGICPMLIPGVVACVGMFEGSDRGSAFGLGAGLLLVFTNSDSAVFYLVALTVSGAAVGVLCKNLLTATLINSFLMSLMSLAICEGFVWLFGLAVGTIPLSAFGSVVLPTAVISFLFTPLFYFPVRGIFRSIDER